MVISDGEPSGLLEAWSGAALAVIVNALHGPPGRAAPCPGRIHWITPAELEGAGLDDDPRQQARAGAVPTASACPTRSGPAGP